MIPLTVLSACLALIAAAGTGYLLVLTLLSFARRGPSKGGRNTRFAIVIPAHDEEASVAETVHSILSTDYPATGREVVVVADNCSDATAARAREAGARVLERSDPERRGKGYALELAFDTLLREATVDALVVIDADSTVSRNALDALDARVAAGAAALQMRYGVRNIDAGWRTRLMAIALGMFHDLRSLGREQLRVSCGLRGNGMCFTADLLRAHPHRAFGLVEDVEYGIALGLAGVRVEYVHDAEVLGEMVTSGRAAASQRQRWEGGRAAVRKQHLAPLLGAARRSRIALDLAVDILLPPLSRIAALVLAGLVGEGALWAFGLGPTVAVWLWLASAVALAAYVLRGLALSGLGMRGLVVLAAAPAYMLWKVLAVQRGPATTWVRTTRQTSDQ
ncbi:MAG: glycosyltransferase family 2 protein [Planctomycetota bacterium]